jgi:glutaredoxin
MNKIIVYGAEWCGFCHSMKQYLDQKKIAYEYKDIEKDEAGFNELMEKLDGQANYRGIPVTDIAGDIILGFDRPKVDAAIAKHKIES